MRMHRWGNDRTSRPRRPSRRHGLRVYTPTMDSFERFMREMVGLNADRSESGPGEAGKLREERKRG
jgi:hypothetical protein